MKVFFIGLSTCKENCIESVRRIESQVNGLSQLGNETHFAYCMDGQLFVHIIGSEKQYPLPEDTTKQSKFLCNTLCNVIESNQYDYIYIRNHFIDRLCIELASCAKEKCFGAKVIFETVCSPDRNTYKSQLQEYKAAGNKEAYKELRRLVLHHQILQHRFSKLADCVVVFGEPAEQVWGIPAISVNTGIDVAGIRKRENLEIHGDPISILGVAEDYANCGFERVIHGLSAYQSEFNRDAVSFDIVGDKTKLKSVIDLAEQTGLDCVHFLGKKTTDEMTDLYDTHSVALSCLGLYHKQEVYLSPVITKEFCAAGIPFVYAYEDLSLNETVPFALKIANNDSPVNISLIAEFVWRCRLDKRLTQTERKFAEKYYDWRVIMKRVIEFTATGRREV